MAAKPLTECKRDEIFHTSSSSAVLFIKTLKFLGWIIWVGMSNVKQGFYNRVHKIFRPKIKLKTSKFKILEFWSQQKYHDQLLSIWFLAINFHLIWFDLHFFKKWLKNDYNGFWIPLQEFSVSYIINKAFEIYLCKRPWQTDIESDVSQSKAFRPNLRALHICKTNKICHCLRIKGCFHCFRLPT